MKFFNKRKLLGFTFLEILVIVFIIALLISIAVIGTRTIGRKTRDALRIADIRSVQNALELYRRDNGFYPSSLATNAPLIAPNGKKTYLSRVPVNPQPRTDTGKCKDVDYTYTSTNPLSYSLVYCLSTDTSNPNSVSSESGVNAGTLAKAGTYEATPQGTLRLCTPNCKSAGKDLGADDGCGGVCGCWLDEPTTAPSSISFPEYTRLRIVLNVSRGNGNSVLVLAKPAIYTANVSGVTSTPEKGAVYSLSTYKKIVPPASYKVVDTNIVNGSGTISLVKTADLPNATGFDDSTSETKIMTRYSGYGQDTINFTYTKIFTGSSNSALVNAQFTEVPVDGVRYNTSTTCTDGAFCYGIGDRIGEAYVVAVARNINLATFSINNFQRNNWYGFKVFEFNNDATHVPNYLPIGFVNSKITSP